MHKMNDISRLGLYVLIMTVFFALSPSMALAADGDTLGGVIKNVLVSTDKVPKLFLGFSYLMGLFFGFWGVMKLKDHVESPGNTTIWEPIKRFVAGGGFFALPAVMGAAVRTMDGDNGGEMAYSKFNAGGAGSLGLDGMMVKLVSDMWVPMHHIIVGFCYLAGIIFIIMGISRLLKSEQDGPRGPASIGTIMTFLVGGALLSVDRMLGSTLTSLFGQNKTASFGELAYKAGMDGAALGHAHAVIAAIIGFVAIIGWVSFVRGLFILRGVAEGDSQASMMAAITHILGGAIAVNLGGFIMVVQNTLGISEYGINFGGG